MDWHRRLVRLYPRVWRARYGEEFEALLEECLHSPLDVIDIALGALDAHLGLGHEVNWRSMNMVNKRRTAVLLVFAGYIGFVVAGLGLYGLVDDSPAAPLLQTNAALAFSWHAVQAAAVLALAAVVVGGLPLALTVIRRALTTSRRDLRWLLVPVAAFLAVALYAGLLASVAFGAVQIPGVARSVAPNDFPIGNRMLLGGFMLVFAAGAAASTMAVWRVVSNSEAEVGTLTVGGRTTSVQLYQLAFPLSVVAAACMLVMLAGTLRFGWLAGLAVPQWFAGDYGLLLTPTRLSFGLTVAIMVLSVVAAFVGVVRGLSTRAQAAG